MFHVVIKSDVSLRDLIAIHAAGGAVLKSPHVGNVYPNNLAVLTAGLRCLMCDRTIGEKDKNFHPHLIISGGRSERISDPTVMTTHALVDRHVSTLGSRWFSKGARVVDAHLHALRAALPDARFFTHTEFLKRDQDLVMEVLRHLTDQWPRTWTHLVTRAGIRTRVYRVDNWKDVMRLGVYGLTNDEEGLLIPNIWAILLDGVLEALRFSVSEVHHLSGPDMCVYIDGMTDDLSAAYTHIQARMPDQAFPDELIMNVVPVAGMRLAVLGHRASVLDELVEAYEKLRADDAARGAFIKGSDAAVKRQSIDVSSRWRDTHMRWLFLALNGCPEIFYDIAAANTTTQYDLLNHGLYVHPRGLEMSMAEIDEMMKFLFRLYRKQQERAAS